MGRMKGVRRNEVQWYWGRKGSSAIGGNVVRRRRRRRRRVAVAGRVDECAPT